MIDIKALDKVFDDGELPDEMPVQGIVPVVRPGFTEPPMEAKKFLSLVDDPKGLFDFDKTKLTPLQQAYIMAYAVRGTKTQACKVSGVTLNMVDKWMKESEEFRQALQSAVDVVADALEEEAMRRALAGSDKLLVEMLKATRPEKYDRKSQINVSGSVVHSWADLAMQASRMIEADYDVKEEIEDEDKDTEEE